METKCVICGKDIEKKAGNQKFCSHKCYIISRRRLKKIIRAICPICKREFQKIIYNQIICSKECKKISRRRPKTIVRVFCTFCKKEFEKLSRSKRKYCSEKCEHDYFSAIRKLKKEKINCKVCGKELLGIKTKYCSPECTSKFYNKSGKRNKDETKINCRFCLGEITRPHWNKKFCSSDCLGKWHRKFNQKRIEKEAEYRKSNRRKESLKKYNLSEKGLMSRKKCAKNPKTIERMKKYYKESPKGIAIRRNNLWRYRAKKAKTITQFTKKEWKEKLEKSNGFCSVCSKYVGIEKLTLDHIAPISKAPEGFIYTINDVRPVCKSCNSSLGAKIKKPNKNHPALLHNYSYFLTMT